MQLQSVQSEWGYRDRAASWQSVATGWRTACFVCCGGGGAAVRLEPSTGSECCLACRSRLPHPSVRDGG